MRILIIFSFILIHSLNNALIQKLTNPILPMNLENSRIIISKHTFVSYLDISELRKIKSNLQEQVNFIIERKNFTDMSDKLIKQAQSLLFQNDHLLETILPNMRHKRGLINLGGKISKWLFGTLDSEDGKRIDTILDYLNNNDHLLKDEINNEISYSKEFMSKTNHSLFQIKSNILTIKSLIDKYQDSINEINTLELIINCLITLQNQLNQIVNAITFATLNKIHPTLLSIENLNTIINKMQDLYSLNQIAQFKSKHSYYMFFGIQLLYKDERIIFLIHCPILMTTPFKTFFLYPVPIQNKIIPPQKPYLILNENNELYQYQEELCEKIEDTFYCHNHLQAEEDCIVSIILKNEAKNCSTVSVHVEKMIANQISPQNILLTTPSYTIITEGCSIEKHQELQPGSYLITIPEKCHYTINQEQFSSENENLSPVTIIELPSLDVSKLRGRSNKIKLNSMDIEELSHLAKKMNNHHEIALPVEPKENHSIPTWLLVIICFLICAITYIGVTCYYRNCYPYPIKLFRRKKNLNEAFSLNDDQPSQPVQP